MLFDKPCTPDAAAGQKSAANYETPFGDKRAVAKLAGGFSKRWVDLQMAAGMPHMRVGPRRVRFDLAEVREWLLAKYHVQRRGAVKATAKGRAYRKSSPAVHVEAAPAGSEEMK